MSVPFSVLQSELQPGTIIEFGDLSELRDFEETIAPLVEPRYDPEVWAGRLALKEFVYPPKFHGRIVDITLTVMENPYEQLLSARERGWMFHGRGKGVMGRTSELSKQTLDRYMGFEFTANALSTGRGRIGSIDMEMFYFPVEAYRAYRGKPITPTHTIKQTRLDRSGTLHVYEYESPSVIGQKHIVDENGETIRRILTRPHLDRESFIQLDETSRRIGFRTLQTAIRHPIIQPMRD